MSTALLSSAMTIMRFDAAATIFSRSSAPPPPLISTKLRIEFVRPVYGQVELRHFIERGERHAKFAAKRGGALRGRHADHRQAARLALGKQPHEFLGGRTGADAEPHAVLDMGERGSRRFDLQRSRIHGLSVRLLRRALASLPDGKGFNPLLASVDIQRLSNCVSPRTACAWPTVRAIRQSSLRASQRFMKRPIIVFDLDGTLVDTAPDLLDSLNHSLMAGGATIDRHERLPPVVGHGGRVMIERAYAAQKRMLDPAEHDRLFDLFLDHYGNNIPGRSQPYPGVPAALTRLAAAGYLLPSAPTRPRHFPCACWKALGLGRPFRRDLRRR